MLHVISAPNRSHTLDIRVNEEERNGNNPLCLRLAARAGNHRVVEKMIASGVPVDAVNNATNSTQKTALHQACLGLIESEGAINYLSIIRYLIGNGADSTIKDAHGRTPLDYLLNKWPEIETLLNFFLSNKVEILYSSFTCFNFAGCNLHEACLEGALFNKCDFTNISLNGTNLHNATFIDCIADGNLLTGEYLQNHGVENVDNTLFFSGGMSVLQIQSELYQDTRDYCTPGFK